ncbi:MAG: STAS domain-containing protein [Methylococcaceae bacterium]|nr:STAS domain-containing protein [Methylococcaceae bacterium]
MQIKTKNINGVLVITLEEKRLDSRLAVTFKDNFNQLMAAENRFIIFDLSQVDFIDSSGIGCLVACLKLIGPKGRLVIWGLKSPVEAMFKLTRMDRVFKLCSTEEEALLAIGD